MHQPSYFAGIEAGGTKTFVAVGNEHGAIFERIKIQTTTPAETMPNIIQALTQLHHHYPFDQVGVAAFGPLDPIISSPTYGSITSTPKVSWQNFDFIGTLQRHFKHWHFAFDTDVNGAALAEYLWGYPNTCNTLVYLTIGTGIGGGIIHHGNLLHGAMHPELGHFYLPRHPQDQHFRGCCPYHQDCLEGLASGTALQQRWHVSSPSALPADHIAWEIQAHYLAHAIVTYMCCFAPDKIILGGGVSKQPHLINQVTNRVGQLVNGYLCYPGTNHIQHMIAPASFSDNTGVKGALALAHTINQTKGDK